MKRLCFLVMLMVLGSSAHAGSSLSFVVGGHRVRIEAPQALQSRVMPLGFNSPHPSKPPRRPG